MKRIFNISLAAFALVAIFMSCNKEVGNPDEILNPDKQKEQVNPAAKTITITATLSDATTKVSFDPVFGGTDGHKPTSMAHTWQEGDKLRVTDESDSSVSAEFDLISGEGTDTGVFQGTIAVATSYSVEVIPAGTPSEGNIQTQAKDGDTAHLKYVAGATGVTNLKNFTLTETSAIIGIIAKLPTDVAVTVDKLEIEKSTDDFVTSEKLTINLTNSEDVNNDDVLEVYANIPTGWTIAAGTKMFLRFGSKNANHTVYTRYQEFADAPTITAGAFNYIKMNCAHIDQYAGKDDAGSSTAPYLIADKYQMDAMHDLMDAGSTTYFKLIDNIDMTGISWVGLNNTATGGKFNKYIYFDGNNKTVSNLTPDVSKDYPSLFGVLQGSVKDLTIDHFTASSVGAKKCGAFAGYIGTGTDYTGDKTIDNVHVTNSSISGGTNYCGGFAGQMNRAGYNITNCTVEDTDITSSSYAAGFIAYIQQTGTISDIIVKGCNVKSTGYANSGSVPSDGFAGGIAARVDAAVDFDRCYYQKNTTTNRTATITGPKNDGSNNGKISRYIGGIVGYVKNVAATFDDCHVNTVTLALNEAGSNNNGRYMGGAFGYIGSSVKVGESNACTVTAISADMSTNYTRNYVAGFIGYNDGGTIKNSSASGSIVSSGGLGGFVAVSNGGSFVDCSSSVEISGVGNLGGFVGMTETTAPTFTRCEASGSVVASGDYSGGFVGNSSVGSYNNCIASGTITSTKTYVGGFVGCIKAGTVTKCSATGGASSTGNFVGGFAGGAGDPATGVQEGNVTINTSMSDGNVSGNSTVGGLVAYAIDGTLEISNSYSTCNLQGSGRRRGGLIAWVENADVTVNNCYASGTIDGNFEMGGLVGLVSVSSLNMSKSAAWNTRITATNRADSNWSSAAVVGVTYLTCTLTDNYRNPNMDSLIYWGTNEGCSINLPNAFQHANVSASAPLTDPDGYAVTSGTMRPYQGKCDASKTLSQLASTTLGWDGNVWDFTDDLPTLK